MRPAKTISILSIILIIGACSAAKKSSITATTAKPASASLSGKPADGIYVPGDEELTAILQQYKDATLDQLKQGYTIYAEGACINCHRAKNIYLIEDAYCKQIIDDMAQRAKISDEQKEVVYKYVLAVKAVQPKEVK